MISSFYHHNVHHTHRRLRVMPAVSSSELLFVQSGRIPSLQVLLQLFFSDKIVRCRRELLQFEDNSVFSFCFVYSSHRGLLFLYFYLYSITSVICRPSDHAVGQAPIRTRAGRSRDGNADHQTTTPRYTTVFSCVQDSTLIMQLLRDNLTLWTSDTADDSAGGDAGDKDNAQKNPTQQEGQHDHTACLFVITYHIKQFYQDNCSIKISTVNYFHLSLVCKNLHFEAINIINILGS